MTRPDPCKLCGGPVPQWWSVLPSTCPACFKHPETQDRIVALLAKQQTARIARNGVTVSP